MSFGVIVATNIARRLDELGWGYDDLAAATGISLDELLRHRADASDMGVNEFQAIARACGVSVASLAVEHDS